MLPLSNTIKERTIHYLYIEVTSRLKREACLHSALDVRMYDEWV